MGLPLLVDSEETKNLLAEGAGGEGEFPVGKLAAT
jgi:hypothetical protein